jgi:hypothetical protein
VGGLASYVAGVKTSSKSRIGRSFNDGAPVRENRYLIWLLPEPQHEFVLADASMPGEPLPKIGQIDMPLAVSNLNRVPAAKPHLRLRGPGKVYKISLPTTSAIAP